MTNLTAPQTPTPHLASLAAALKQADGEALAQVFADLSEEALVLCESAPTEQLWKFWLYLSENFQHQESLVRESKAVSA